MHGCPRSKNTITGKQYNTGLLREQLLAKTMEWWKCTNHSQPSWYKWSHVISCIITHPEDIAHVLCFPHVFWTSKESILSPSEDCWYCQLLEWKLNSETSAFRVNLFGLLSSTVRWLELRLDTYKVKPSRGIRLVSTFYLTLFSYTDGLNKCGIREVQWFFQSIAWYKQPYFSEKSETR